MRVLKTKNHLILMIYLFKNKELQITLKLASIAHPQPETGFRTFTYWMATSTFERSEYG